MTIGSNGAIPRRAGAIRWPATARSPTASACERQRSGALRDRADLVIDTTALTAGRSEARACRPFRARRRPGCASLSPRSAYRHGMPRDADLVFDVRFLDNPYYVAELRPLTGRDPAVGAHSSRATRISRRSSPGCGACCAPCCRATSARARPISRSRSAAPAAGIARSIVAERLAGGCAGGLARSRVAHRDFRHRAPRAGAGSAPDRRG